MTNREIEKFKLQIDTHWGDPLYTTSNIDSGNTLTYEVWEYAKSRSKSIGILLEIDSSNEGNGSPFCLTIYTSGKLLSTINSGQIVLNDFMKLFMTNSMTDKLDEFPINYGNVIFFDELLFLVERGSLLLFSWSQSRLEWIQVPILYLFNIFIKNQEPFKLSNFISYSKMRRSGNKFLTCSNKNGTKLQEAVASGKCTINCIDIEKYTHSGIYTESIKTLSSINSNYDSYLTNNLKIAAEKNILFLSKQPQERFLLRSDTVKTNDHFVLSIVSINSEVRFKVSSYEF